MMNRPLATSPRYRRGAFLVLGLLAAGSLAACADPNFIGLQDYGTVNGNVVDQNGKPVPTAVVSVTGTTGIPFTTQTDGAFNLTNVAVGEQTITVNAAGYAPNNSTTVIVVKNQNATVGNVVIVSTVVGH